MKRVSIIMAFLMVLICIAALASGCWDARARDAGEPGREPDVITLEEREITVRTPKPGVHIVVPKMKTKYVPEEREESEE